MTDYQRANKKNRLAFENSPYLLQHASNPVDWYPWGEEAFEKARKEDKPVFLSIGYSTCHWCHVMARESFEDEDVARILNQFFVSIKVDREEKPDVDHLYMTACQAITGRGGWPLSVFLTPQGEPFFAGTYFPKTSRMGLPGFKDLLLYIANLWKTDRNRIHQVAKQLTDIIKAQDTSRDKKNLTETLLRRCYEALARSFDPRYGGFLPAPKFPSPHQLTYLLRWYYRVGQPLALEIVEKTLVAMRNGGIFDQIGYGFHRYSVDEKWLIPHFEKMLYDQALCMLAYCEAFHLTKKPFFKEVVHEIAQYVLRDLRDSDGGFFSAEDADTEGKEGAFYLWDKKEVVSLLGKDLGEVVSRFYGITDEGNFEDGKTILHVAIEHKTLAKIQGMEENDLRQILEKARERLFEARQLRVRPQLDDKIIVAWNGLMMGAFARASWVLGEPSYAEVSRNCADFILRELRTEDGRLMRAWRQGKASHTGCLEDYSALIWGLLELYEATFEIRWLIEALNLTNLMLEIFWDSEHGGFFMTPRDTKDLLVLPKDSYDGAMPSGNSMAAVVLAKLARITGREDFEEKAWATLGVFSSSLEAYPSGYTYMLTALDFLLGPCQEVVIAGKKGNPETIAMLEELRKDFSPRRTVILLEPDDHAKDLRQIVPHLQFVSSDDKGCRVYLCYGRSCLEPVNTPEKLRKLLDETKTV
ncbi:MAG: thioredoxin domain-containing protein [Thermodesulforhabdaceae bacterium]